MGKDLASPPMKIVSKGNIDCVFARTVDIPMGGYGSDAAYINQLRKRLAEFQQVAEGCTNKAKEALIIRITPKMVAMYFDATASMLTNAFNTLGGSKDLAPHLRRRFPVMKTFAVESEHEFGSTMAHRCDIVYDVQYFEQHIPFPQKGRDSTYSVARYPTYRISLRKKSYFRLIAKIQVSTTRCVCGAITIDSRGIYLADAVAVESASVSDSEAYSRHISSAQSRHFGYVVI